MENPTSRSETAIWWDPESSFRSSLHGRRRVSRISFVGRTDLEKWRPNSALEPTADSLRSPAAAQRPRRCADLGSLLRGSVVGHAAQRRSAWSGRQLVRQLRCCAANVVDDPDEFGGMPGEPVFGGDVVSISGWCEADWLGWRPNSRVQRTVRLRRPAADAPRRSTDRHRGRQ